MPKKKAAAAKRPKPKVQSNVGGNESRQLKREVANSVLATSHSASQLVETFATIAEWAPSDGDDETPAGVTDRLVKTLDDASNAIDRHIKNPRVILELTASNSSIVEWGPHVGVCYLLLVRNIAQRLSKVATLSRAAPDRRERLANWLNVKLLPPDFTPVEWADSMGFGAEQLNFGQLYVGLERERLVAIHRLDPTTMDFGPGPDYRTGTRDPAACKEFHRLVHEQHMTLADAEKLVGIDRRTYKAWLKSIDETEGE